MMEYEYIKQIAKEFAEQIIENSEQFVRYDNGPDYYECPFCKNIVSYDVEYDPYNYKYRGEGHKEDCIVNKATKFIKEIEDN